MNSAPSVIFPVGRSPFEAAAMGLLASIGLIGIALWGWQSRPSAVYMVCAVGLWVACAAAALVGWRSREQGTLRWAEGLWHWEGRAAQQPHVLVSDLRVRLDFQFFMLLEVQCAAAPVRWLWLDAAMSSSHWRALRRAIYAERHPGAVDAGRVARAAH